MITSVILLSVAIFLVAILVPDISTNITPEKSSELGIEKTTPQIQGLPWQIEKTNDTIRVFGITLGYSTLSDAEKIFLGDGEISLFQSKSGLHSVEAYFDKVDFAGLTAKIILVMDIPASVASQMYERGVRISKVGSGSNKISIATEDLHRTRNAAVASITYLPAINLNAKQLEARFGKPAQRITEPDSTAEHWLYPSLGLDVTLDEKNKEILQYVKPSVFSTISKPLEIVKQKTVN